jgi:hypothetical protein
MTEARRWGQMNWETARQSTIELWKEIRRSVGSADSVELLREINAVSDLCVKAREEAADQMARCRFCIAYQQFGGCEGATMRMSECAVDRDWEGLRTLIDDFVEQLEALEIPRQP